MSYSNIITRTLKQITHQPVRYVGKTFKYREAYGKPPLFTEEKYEKAAEEGRLEDLKFSRIRFANIAENSSPLHDDIYSQFVRFIMRGGRKSLAEELMHDAFYELKCIQYGRMLKQQRLEKEAQEKEGQGKASNNAVNEQDAGDTREIELNPLTIFKTALKNIEPVVVTRKMRRGGATYQVPVPLTKKESEYQARFWLHKAILERPKPRKKNFNEVFAQELLDAYNGTGKVIKKRDDMHKLAEANKAYAHYRWG